MEAFCTRTLMEVQRLVNKILAALFLSPAKQVKTNVLTKTGS